MLLDTIKQFNWLDIFVVIILIRVGYVAIKTGLPVEAFKLLGTVLAIYLSLHYYTGLSEVIKQRLGLKEMPLDFLGVICAVLLVLVGYGIFIALRFAFCRFIKVEAVPQLNKWGGFILGSIRGVFLAGLVIFILAISTIDYLKASVVNSYSGKYLFQIAPNTYTWFWDNLTSKYAANDKFNKTVQETREGLFKK